MRVEAGGARARARVIFDLAHRSRAGTPPRGPVGSKNYAVPVSYRFPLSPRVFAIWMWID